MELVFYTRGHCPLCDRLELMLAPRLKRAGAVLVKRNVDDDPDWEGQFGRRIPVLMLDDEVLMEGRPSEAQVNEAMTRLGL